jgi:hypothetical protein
MQKASSNLSCRTLRAIALLWGKSCEGKHKKATEPAACA